MTRNKFFDIDLKALKIEPADVTSFGDKEKKVMDCLVELAALQPIVGQFEGFKEDEHPRGGKGTKEGGKFVPKGASGTSAEDKEKAKGKDETAEEMLDRILSEGHKQDKKQKMDKVKTGLQALDTNKLKEIYIKVYPGSPNATLEKIKHWSNPLLIKGILTGLEENPTKIDKLSKDIDPEVKRESEKEERNKNVKNLSGKKWQEALSKNEKNVIAEWQTGGYEEIRKAQIGQGNDSSNKLASLFESILNKDGHYKGVVYRGIHDLTDEQIDAIASAKEISFDAVSSSAKDEEATHKFLMSEVPVGEPDKGKSILFKIQTKSGVDLKPVSMDFFKDENEVVLRKGTKYEVVGRKKRTIHQNIEGVSSWDQEIIEVTLNEK